MNTSNPLEQLKDIHLPQAISWWPPAIGWWLVALLIVVLLFGAFLLFRHYQKSAYRRMAIQRINQLFASDSPSLASELNQLLKAVAQQSFSTIKVSRLTTDEWLHFLDSSANTQIFSNGPGKILASAPYEKNPEIEDSKALKSACIQWVRGHK